MNSNADGHRSINALLDRVENTVAWLDQFAGQLRQQADWAGDLRAVRATVVEASEYADGLLDTLEEFVTTLDEIDPDGTPDVD